MSISGLTADPDSMHRWAETDAPGARLVFSILAICHTIKETSGLAGRFHGFESRPAASRIV
jgi:hypothetical protein